MSNAKQRGLPDNNSDFDFAVDMGLLTDAPVEIESFTQRAFRPSESEVRQSPPVNPEPKPQAAPSVERVGEGQNGSSHRSAPRPQSENSPSVTRRTLSEPPVQHRSSRPPRKDVNLDADALRKTMDVVEDIRTQGPQADASASEYIQALAHLGHDARHNADYSRLKRRGHWGSPTAKAFIADLKEAYLRAIGRQYIERYPEAARRQLDELLGSSNAPEQPLVETIASRQLNDHANT